MEAFDPRAIRGIREDPRMAEQQFGNLQDAAQIRKSKNERHRCVCVCFVYVCV